MGKNKLARWSEFASFENVIQPEISDVASSDHKVKGRWHTQIFSNNSPLVLELGCGKGEYTVGLASKIHDHNFIGVDIKGARMWRGAKTANEQKLANVAFLRTRIEFINSFFETDEVDEIWITFPDPHTGGKNANKRLTSPEFLNSYRSFLKNKGLVHLKTDSSELFEYTKKVVLHNKLDIIFSTDDLYSEKLSDEILSITTHYEKLFLNEGLKIKYLCFSLDKEKNIEDGYKKAKRE